MSDQSEMPLTNGQDESVSSLGGQDSNAEVSPELIDHINAVFSQENESNDIGVAPLEPVAEKIAPPTANAQRALNLNRKQQADALIEEGLETEGGLPPDVEPTLEKTNEADAEQPVDAEQANDAAPADLDPNLRFVAQFYGWDDAKIDRLFAADPEMAEHTFGQLLTTFQAMSRQQGVQAPSGQRMQPGTPGAAQQPALQVSQLEQLFANPKAFADANGEQLGQLLVGIQREVYQPLKTALQQVAQIQAEYMVQKQQAVASEATNATGNLAQKFPDVYGNDPAKLNFFQQQTRQNLFTVADQIRAGAYQQGKEMSVTDALNRAHLIVTAGKQDASARQQVRQQVTQRSRKMTARPTQRTNPAGRGVAQGDQAATDAYRTRAAELGMEIGVA